MSSEVVSKALRYLMSLGDWRPKLRLASLFDLANTNYFIPFTHDLLLSQEDSGLFPFQWKTEEGPSLRYTLLAINCLSSANGSNAATPLRTAHRALLSQQAVDGSWNEYPETLGKMRRRQMHPGWTRDLDRAELTSLAARLLIRTCAVSAGESIERAREWLRLFLQGQDYETQQSGDEYSLNPMTMDLVVSTLLELGADAAKPSISDAVILLRRGITRAVNRNARHSPCSLLAGTETLLRHGTDTELLEQVTGTLASIQQRDGSWRQRRGINTPDSGEWTLSALSFLHAQAPQFKRASEEILRDSISLRRFVRSTLTDNEEATRQAFLTRFEEVGVRAGQPAKHLLFASFLYSILEQFYWVTADFDPQSEYLRIILEIGRLERAGLGQYTQPQIIRRALFRGQSLRGQASTRKAEVAESISFFATFLQKGEFSSFRDFATALRAYTLAKAAVVAPSWKRDALLGELLRMHTLHRDDPSSLMLSLKNSLRCLPGVGEKVSSLFLYYVGHIFRVWKDVPLQFLELPIDWNIVKPYTMLQLTSVPLEGLKVRPHLAADSIQQTARELFREDPVKLYGLWVVGHKWCARPWMCRDRNGKYCWMYAQCPYPQSRR